MTKRVGITLLVSLAAGCTLAETQPEVELILLSPFPTRAESVRVRVDAEVGGIATVLVDGKARARVSVGQLVDVPIDGLADGEHALRAELRDVGRELRSTDVLIAVDRTAPTLVAADPTPGPTSDYDQATHNLTASVTFDEPVADASGLWGHDDFLSRSQDGRTLRYLIGTTGGYSWTLEATVRDAAGNTRALALAWSELDLSLVLIEPDLTKPLGGVITLRATFAAPSVTARLGPASVELLSGVPGELDLRAVPDGNAHLSFVAQGYVGWSFSPVTVDNTPPRLLSCGPARMPEGPYGGPTAHPPEAAPVGDSIIATFSEPVALEDGSPGAYDLLLSGPVRPTSLPTTWEGIVPVVRDRAGNEGPAGVRCSATFPEWLAPAGPGPLEGPSGASKVWAFVPLAGEEDWVRVAGVMPGFGDAGGDGFVFGEFTSTIQVWLRRNPPGTVVEDAVGGPRGSAWVQRRLDGSGYSLVGEDLSVHWGFALEDVAASAAPVHVLAEAPLAIAWTQAREGGGRELRVFWLPDGWAPRPPAAMTPVVMADPTKTPLAAALTATRPRIAYVEAAPGRAAWLLERKATATLDELGDVEGPLNVDPALDASTPAAESTDATDLLAWIEAGELFVRLRPAGGAYGPPERMSDPAATARSPAFAPARLGPVLGFVETTAAGDHLVARRFVESGPGAGAWINLPLPEVGTALPEAMVPWPGVLWRDGAGDVRYRRHNE